MATKSVITKIRRKKMAEASHTTGSIAKITHIALGSGDVNASRQVIEPLPENIKLNHEVIRKPYTSSTKKSETSYEYVIKLEENELLGVEISKMDLIDADGNVVGSQISWQKEKTRQRSHSPSRTTTRRCRTWQT